MKIILRVLLSVLSLILTFALIDYYSDGLLKYILWGITSAALILYNDKENQKYKKTKESKYYTN